MGYQSESAPWRNFYLTGAQELRNGVKPLPAASTASPDIIAAMSVDMVFDYLSLRLNGPKANGMVMTMNWKFPDINQQYRVTLNNSVLNYFPGEAADKADITLTLNRPKINDLVLGKQTYHDAIKEGSIKIDGDPAKLDAFFSLLEPFDFWFNIVTP